MKTLPRDEAEALWDKYWDEMDKEWFKLEVLQDYTPEDDGPSLRSWIRGDKQKSIELLKTSQNKEWVESSQQKLKQGVKLIRVHIVDKPHSPYIEWELEHYKYVNMAQCGEQVYLLERANAGGLDLPAGDLMIFDKTWAVINTYSQNGLMIGQTFYDETDDISSFLELAKKLKNLAKPL